MFGFIEQLLDQNTNYLKRMRQGIKRVEKYANKRLSCSDLAGSQYYKIYPAGDSDKSVSSAKLGKYCGKAHSPQVQGIKAYQYLKRGIAQAETNINYLEKALSHVKSVDPNVFGKSLPKAYQDFPDYVYKVCGVPSAKDWQERPRQYSTFMPERKIFPTKAGWKVRSKSEVTISDRYYDAGLSFVYEELRSMGNKTTAPDFTILHPITYEEIIHEHFGMVDDPEYFQNGFVSKIEAYLSAGYVPGVNLIITFETKDSPLTADTMDKIIQHYFR